MTQMSDELRQLIERDAMVLKAARAREVYVFGSAAGGQMRENSDIDLAFRDRRPNSSIEPEDKPRMRLGVHWTLLMRVKAHLSPAI